MTEVSRILNQIESDPSASDQLLPLVYAELRNLARQKLELEKPGQTLQATALVHEAYLRLVGGGEHQKWNSRGHFFGAAAEAMRRILVEQARRKKSLRAGGGRQRMELSIIAPENPEKTLDVLALDQAICELDAHDARACQVVKLRYFAGLTVPQVAQALGVSRSTAENDWAYAKSWLRRRIGDEDDGGRP